MPSKGDSKITDLSSAILLDILNALTRHRTAQHVWTVDNSSIRLKNAYIACCLAGHIVANDNSHLANYICLTKRIYF
jgi:hypothetical protein